MYRIIVATALAVVLAAPSVTAAAQTIGPVGPHAASLPDPLPRQLTLDQALAEAQARSPTLAAVRAEVSAALEEVRRIIEDLRPAVFDDVDLVTALRRRCKQLTASGALTVELTAPTTLPPLPPEYETAIYRIAEEALTNVVRHASASRCTVTLEVDDGVRLLVADDGVGFTEAAAAAAAGRCGVGLVSMRERAERLGGSLAIEHRVPGITITVHLPTVKLPGALVAVPT